MPINQCEFNNKPGFKWGHTNKCWTYNPRDEQSKKEAKKNCIRQAIRIEGPEKFKQIMQSEGSEYVRDLLEDDELSDQEFDVIAHSYSLVGNLQEQLLFAQFVETRKIARKNK
jgi:hypothetical protein